jgi:hypothetical protein
LKESWFHHPAGELPGLDLRECCARVAHEEASIHVRYAIESSACCAWADACHKSLRLNACSLPSVVSPKDGMRFEVLGAGNGIWSLVGRDGAIGKRPLFGE